MLAVNYLHEAHKYNKFLPPQPKKHLLCRQKPFFPQQRLEVPVIALSAYLAVWPWCTILNNEMQRAVFRGFSQILPPCLPCSPLSSCVAYSCISHLAIMIGAILTHWRLRSGKMGKKKKQLDPRWSHWTTESSLG